MIENCSMLIERIEVHNDRGSRYADQGSSIAVWIMVR